VWGGLIWTLGGSLNVKKGYKVMPISLTPPGFGDKFDLRLVVRHCEIDECSLNW